MHGNITTVKKKMALQATQQSTLALRQIYTGSEMETAATGWWFKVQPPMEILSYYMLYKMWIVIWIEYTNLETELIDGLQRVLGSCQA